MARNSPIPKQSVPVLGPDGRMRKEWYLYQDQLQRQVDGAETTAETAAAAAEGGGGFSVGAVSGKDASTLPTSDAQYHKRWEDGTLAEHTVINVTVSLGAISYPRQVTITLNGPSAPGWQGAFSIPSDNAVIAIGLSNTKSDGVFPPTQADEDWTATVDPGNVGSGAPTASAVTSAPFTVPAPLAPGSTAATGAFIDELIINLTTKQWGWNNLFTTVPFDPDAPPENPMALEAPYKAARWLTQNGHYTTPGDPTTFVAGDPVTAQHQGKVVPFDDLDGNVYRVPGTNTVTVENNNPSSMWIIPDYKLADGSLNPDDVFRITNMMGSYLAASPSDDTTWADQNDWSSGVGDSTPGTAAYMDIVFNLSKGTVSGANLNPGSKVPGQVVPLGDWLGLDGSNNVSLSTPLRTLMTLIAANSYTIPNSLLKDQSILTYSVASQAVTYASGAVAANTLVDSNVASVAIGKLVSGTTVFSSDVYFARGTSQPVVRLGNDGIYLYGMGVTVGTGVSPGVAGNPTYAAAGLTSQPYAVIQSLGIFLYQGGAGPSTTITGGVITLYSQSGSTTHPFLTVASGALLFHSGGSFSTAISSTQIQMLYTGASGVANTLSSAGMVIQNGQYFSFTYANGMIMGKAASLSLPATLTEMSTATQQFRVGDPFGTGFEINIINGAYSFKATASGLYLLHASGPSMQLLNTSLTLYSVDGDTTKPYVVLDPTAGLTLYASASGPHVIMDSSGFQVITGAAQLVVSGSAVNISNPGAAGAAIGLNSFTGGGLVGMSYSGHSVAFSINGGGGSVQIDAVTVVKAQQTGPGNPSGWADATAEAWAQSLYTAIKAHGLTT
jgi:hypothetical protein